MTLILLTIPLGLSYNFSFPYNYRPVDAGTTSLLSSRVKAHQYDTDTWYITYQYGTSTSCNRKFAETDESFTLLDTDCISAFGSTWEFLNSECGIQDTIAGDERFICIGSSNEHSSFWYGSMKYWYFGNQSYVEVDTCTDGTQRFSAVLDVMDDSVVAVWRRGGSSDPDPRYTQNNDICGGGDFDGDGTINYPTIYESPTDLQVVACGGSYHHIIRKGSGIYDLVFDYSHNYQRAYGLSLPSWVYNSLDYGVWVDQDEQILHFVAVNDTGGSGDSGLVNVQAWECVGGHTISFMFSETFSQSEINSTANSTVNRQMRTPYIVKDDNDRYNLFYTWYDNGNYYIDVAVEEGDCVCSVWNATEECYGSYRKFNRTCFPEGCDTNTTYWAMDDYCIAGEPCTPEWICLDGDTKVYQQLDCSLVNQTDCIGATPYCFRGECVAECERGYFCFDDVTRAFRDSDCELSEIINCNSTGDGYCFDGRCYEILTPAFDEDASTLDILEGTVVGVKQMLRWMTPPLFKILMAVAITVLILGVFGLVASVGRKATPRRG